MQKFSHFWCNEIKWNYNCPETEVKGFFVLQDENIDPISFERQDDMTHQEMVDNLWRRIPATEPEML